jgi:hypothetical protein
VTGFLRTGPREGTVFSGVAYYKAEFKESSDENDGGDVNLGTLTSWHEVGHISKLFPDAPKIQGVSMWDDPGITSTYLFKSQRREQMIISRHLRWVHDGTSWPGAGTVTQDWIINDAGPALLDGQAPWGPPGVTATYFSPNGSYFEVISANRLWRRDTTDNNPQNWKWVPIADGGGGGAYNLADSDFWKAAPLLDGRKPWDQSGVTAAWYFGAKFFVVSKDFMWTFDGTRWRGLGSLNGIDGWKSAPAAGCL